MVVERLEDRVLLTSTLYVDFGDRFPVAGLTGTVGTLRTATSGVAGDPAVAGPNMDKDMNGDYGHTPKVVSPIKLTLETLGSNRYTYLGTPLGNSTFRTLKKLKILDSKLPSDFTKILASGARSLKTIYLRMCERRGPFLRTVTDTCPNLVSIVVSLEPLKK